jgi:hypothetical protein
MDRWALGAWAVSMVGGCFFSPHFQKGGSPMEPRQEEQQDKVPHTEEKEEKPRRFRIVKLEERIAPRSNGAPTHYHKCGC